MPGKRRTLRTPGAQLHCGGRKIREGTGPASSTVPTKSWPGTGARCAVATTGRPHGPLPATRPQRTGRKLACPTVGRSASELPATNSAAACSGRPYRSDTPTTDPMLGSRDKRRAGDSNRRQRWNGPNREPPCRSRKNSAARPPPAASLPPTTCRPGMRFDTVGERFSHLNRTPSPGGGQRKPCSRPTVICWRSCCSQ